MEIFTGRVAPPVSADAVILPLAPIFTVATANTPVPVVPGMFIMPSLLRVAPRATMSGTGVADAEKSSVFNPELIGAGSVLVQSKLNSTSVDATGAEGVSEMMKLRAACAGISTGAFGVPVGRFVSGSVA